MTKYSDLLRDPRWQKKRLAIMQRDNFTCRRCTDTETTLNVHHCYYERGAMPWDYPDASLLTLCEACHQIITECDSAKHSIARQLACMGVTSEEMEEIAGAFVVFEEHYQDLNSTCMIRFLLTDPEILIYARILYEVSEAKKLDIQYPAMNLRWNQQAKGGK